MPRFIDVTAISALMILCDIVYVTIKKKGKILINNKQLVYTFLIIFFQCVVFISLFYTASTGFGYYKSLLLILNIIAFIYPIFRKEITIESFFSLLYNIIIPFSVFIIFLNFVRWTPYKTLINIERADEIRGHYLTIGMFLGLIAYYNICFRNQLKSNFDLKVVLPIFLLVISSARGPLIFFIITMLLFFLFKIKSLKLRIRNTNLVFGGIIALVIFATPLRNLFFNLFQRTFNRFYVMFNSDSGGASISGRLDFLSFSFDSITEGPIRLLFGSGIGSFMFLYTGNDGRGYPHNILIESLFELGVLGFLILSSFLFFIFFYKTKKVTSKLILIFLILCYSKTGGLEDIRIIYGMYALYLSSLYSPKVIEL